MSSLVRRSHNKSLKVQVKKMSPICNKTKNDQLFSKSSQQDSGFDQDEFGTKKCIFLPLICSPSPLISLEEYKFLVLELFASWLSFSCLVLGKKITLSSDYFSRTASGSCYPSSPLAIKSESPSQILDFNVENYSVSLLNLELEDSELIPNYDHLNFDDHLQSGFPSPSFKSTRGPSTTTTHKVESQSKAASEESEFEDLNAESEPLFWPFEKKFAWNSQETWACFTMSPRKDNQKSRSSCCDSLELRVNERKRPVFMNKASSTTMPSRLSRARASKSSDTKIATLEIMENPSPIRDESSMDKNLDGDFPEEELIKQAEEVSSIEVSVGLGEFDGHEGLDTEFNQFDFSLDDSLS